VRRKNMFGANAGNFLLIDQHYAYHTIANQLTQ
jgi:hypothetical protein